LKKKDGKKYEVMKNDNLAIVIIGYDGYSDLWDNFFFLLNKYWSDRKYQAYLVTNLSNIKYDKTITIPCGEDCEWSKKVYDFIKNCNEKYVLLLLEDFFISKYVDNKYFEEIYKIIVEDDIDYFKLNTFSKIKGKKYKNYTNIKTINYDQDYAISLQPAIWKTNFLMTLLGVGNYNAWKFESDRILNKKKIDSGLKLLYDNRNILNIEHAVVQGKYIPNVVKKFKKQNIKFNYQKRLELNFYENFKYEFKKNFIKIMPKFIKKTIKFLLYNLGFKTISQKNK